ncbi:hypothetical protein [Burkholderia phage FLC9]|nr:hypothetical protein [Burkholderia phage FLC9]
MPVHEPMSKLDHERIVAELEATLNKMLAENINLRETNNDLQVFLSAYQRDYRRVMDAVLSQSEYIRGLAGCTGEDAVFYLSFMYQNAMAGPRAKKLTEMDGRRKFRREAKRRVKYTIRRGL